MNQLIRPLCAVLGAALLLLGGCRDKHEPVKPTVAAAAVTALR